MASVQVLVASRGHYVDEAAEVWARATAARDRAATVAPLELSRPIIQGALDGSARSILLVAVEADDRVVGFAVTEPVRADETTAEVRYVGVHPDRWGNGVGRDLMAALPERLRDASFTHAQLSVYIDNARAIALYERLGWLPHGVAVPHARSGRLEQRYLLNL